MVNEPTIREATAADLPPLRALVERAYRGDTARAGWTHEADLLDGQRTDEAALAEVLADPRQRMLVAEASGRLIGCVQVADRGNGLAYLGLLTVDPALQAAGLGRRLVGVAEATAQSFGATRMEMTVIRQRGELIAYYERRGYRATGDERPFPYGDERVGMPMRPDLTFVVLAKELPARR